MSAESSFYVSLVAGGLAGTTVDVALFPLDTLKTRLQSPQGFFAAGGFRGLYKGMQSVALGSAPGSALFFITYDTLGREFKKLYGVNAINGDATKAAVAHLSAASLGEVAACLVRVPTDNVKVKLQSGMYSTGVSAVKDIYNPADLKAQIRGINGFYRGFGATVIRDVPFAMLQFPLYEYLKEKCHVYLTRKKCNTNASISYEEAYESTRVPTILTSICGSIAGGVSAALTTPLDVARTRLMLGADKFNVPYKGIVSTLSRVYQEGGINLLFSGVTPRIAWISIGGSVFFGAYETYKYLLTKVDHTKKAL